MTALVLDRARALESDLSRRLLPAIAAAVAALLLVALVAVADFPTGAASVERLVPDGARLAAQTEVEDVTVLVAVAGNETTAMVAYEADKGWLGVDLSPVPAATVATWAATEGEGPVPALSVVYGRAPGVQVQVRWDDGTITFADTARDGSYVTARAGRVGVDRLAVVDRSGEAVIKMDEL